MQKGIILYQSKYGATKKYADWLREATQYECLEIKKAKVQQIKKYDIIILGGGIYASGIAGISFLKRNIQYLKSGKLIVFCVGASPYEENAFREICAHNLTGSLKDIPCFYCRGMLDEEVMSFKDRTLCKMLKKAISRQDPSTLLPWQAALMETNNKAKCDWTDKKYLDPLLDCVKTLYSKA